MKIQTFIFVHDEKIILDFEKNGKFKEIENLKYVFLSNNPCEQIRSMSNVIIARDFEDNIEKWNRTLIAYTGWYLLWKNNLIDADFINLFEYDIILDKNFQDKLKQNLTPKTKVVSYVPIEIHDYWFIQDGLCNPLLNSIQKHYNIDFRKYVREILDPVTVGVTSNQSMSLKTFNEFMTWMEPIIDDIKEEKMAGHMPERAFPLFYTYYDREGFLLDGVLSHFRMDTHETQGRTKAYFDANYEKLVKS